MTLSIIYFCRIGPEIRITICKKDTSKKSKIMPRLLSVAIGSCSFLSKLYQYVIKCWHSWNIPFDRDRTLWVLCSTVGKALSRTCWTSCKYLGMCVCVVSPSRSYFFILQTAPHLYAQVSVNLLPFHLFTFHATSPAQRVVIWEASLPHPNDTLEGGTFPRAVLFTDYSTAVSFLSNQCEGVVWK